VAVVDADNLKENPQPPPVVIERVTANGKIVAAYGAGGTPASSNSAAPLELCQGAAHLRLAPGQRQQVEFDFTALTFTRPASIGFKYRLHDLDVDWVEAGTRRTATYAQVPPGRYHFQVLACNSDGVWNETGAALELTAEPYWWETAWFRVAGPLTAAGLLTGAILLGWRRRHRRQIERLEMQQATERERARIARDIHDDLGATLTQIVMLSDSTGTVAPSPAGSLGKIHQVALTMTQTMDEIVWAVNPRHDRFDQLAMYLDAYAQEYLDASGLQSCVDFPSPLPRRLIAAPVRHNLFLAFKEALNNLVRHAAARQVWICLTVQPGGFSLSVEDDGQGFSVDPYAAPRADAGNGLANMRARLAMVGGHCNVDSVPGRGTRVVFELPWEP
jgi:signal transduction histidine kinase